MNLHQIAEHLELSGVGVRAKTIFTNMIPINVNNGILLRNPLVGTKIDYELIGYIHSEFQIIVRASGYDSGEALMKKAFQALTLSQRTLGNLHIQECYPMFEPVVYPLSDGNLLEFSTDFRIVGYEVP